VAFAAALLALGAVSCGGARMDSGSAAMGSAAWLQLVDGNGTVRSSLVLPDRRFSHVYVHSINLGRVDEEFTVERNGSLLLERLRYDQTGSGMPSDAEGGFSIEDGRFVLAMSRRFRELPVRVSPMAGHGIQTAEGFLAFADIFETGELVTLVAVPGKVRVTVDEWRTALRGEQ
jgi:hypothetical protein